MLYDVHFWLGKDTSQDEAGVAAYKTVELDDLLKDLPVQYREVQGHESVLFKRLFPVMKVLHGGIDSGFNLVTPENYVPRLLHVKGKKCVRVVQVDKSVDSLNNGDVFVLDAGLKLFQFNGLHANVHERKKANQFVRDLKQERSSKPTITVLGTLQLLLTYLCIGHNVCFRDVTDAVLYFNVSFLSFASHSHCTTPLPQTGSRLTLTSGLSLAALTPPRPPRSLKEKTTPPSTNRPRCASCFVSATAALPNRASCSSRW